MWCARSVTGAGPSRPPTRRAASRCRIRTPPRCAPWPWSPSTRATPKRRCASAADAGAEPPAEPPDDLTDVVARSATDTAPDAPSEVPPVLAHLTARERQIAELVAQGLGNQAIATRLHVSRRTVEAHLSAIFRRSSPASRSALAALVLRGAPPPG